MLLRPLNVKGKLRRRERAPLEPKFSSSLMLRRIFAPVAWRWCFPALAVEEGRSSEWPRRAISSADVPVVVVVVAVLIVVSMVIDRDVVVALAKMEAGSGMKFAGAPAVWTWWLCESEKSGKVGVDDTECKAGLECAELEGCHALSCCPGVDKSATLPRVDGDGEPMEA